MGIGPRIKATCAGAREVGCCNWETDSHVTDVRKFGVECFIHLDAFPDHIVLLSNQPESP